MKLKVDIPVSYVPILKNICNERLSTLGSRLEEIKIEIEEVTQMIKTLDAAPEDDYQRWSIAKKIEMLLLETEEPQTLKSLTKSLMEKENTELNYRTFSIAVQSALNTMPLVEKYKNDKNQFQYTLKNKSHALSA